METVYLDTHIVVWLRQKELDKLSSTAIELIERADKVLVSAMVVLELKYLYEIGRLSVRPEEIIEDLSRMIGLQVDEVDFYKVVLASMDLTWTRDAFDRMIAANALMTRAKLITKDSKMLEHLDVAVF